MKLRLVSLAALLLLAPSAHATTAIGTAISAVGGAVQEISTATVPSLTAGGLASTTTIYVFREKLNYQLTANVGVNISTTGIYPPAAATPGIIPAGTSVTSYLIHFNPTAMLTVNLTGTIDFDQDILGVIANSTTLDNTDATFAIPGVTYDTGDPNRGFEITAPLTPDQISFTSNRHLGLNLTAANSIDEIRVLLKGDGRGVTFSIDGQSASYGTASSFGPALDAGQILTVGTGGPPGPNPPVAAPAAPGVCIAPARLGLVAPAGGRLEIDAFSFGRDAGTRLRFSVDEWAGGLAGGAAPDVRSEGGINQEASADLFAYQAPFAPPAAPGVVYGNKRTHDGAGGAGLLAFGLAEPNAWAAGVPDAGDNLDEIDLGTVPGDLDSWVFFSLDGSIMDPAEGVAGYGTATANGYTGADILVGRRVLPPGVPSAPAVYASYGDLGLGPGDDIDALIVNIAAGTGGEQTPNYASSGGADKIYFSLRRGSPSLMNPLVLDQRYHLMLTEADVIEPTSAGPAIYIPGEALALRTARAGPGPNGVPDDLDGMDILYPVAPPFADGGQAVVPQGGQIECFLSFFDIFFEFAGCRIFMPPRHGTVYLNGQTGRATYVHDGSPTTEDSFSYIVYDTDGEVSEPITMELVISSATGVGAGTPAADLRLSLVGRNPSAQASTFAFSAPRGGRVQLEIYDAQGRRVRSLFDAEVEAGSQQRAIWDGRDDGGRPAGAGLFFARFSTPDGGRTLRVVRLR